MSGKNQTINFDSIRVDADIAKIKKDFPFNIENIQIIFKILFFFTYFIILYFIFNQLTK